MLLFGIPTALIILRMQVAARGGDRVVAEVVTHVAEVHQAADHVRARRLA